MNSINCSPIKPKYTQSFGNTKETMNAAINLLEDFNSDGFTERNINQMTGMTERLHDGPMKSFLKILGIAATTFIGFKGATSKAAKVLTKNATIQKRDRRVLLLRFCYLLYLSTKLCITTQNLSKSVNVVSRGSPSRMRIVRRISLGITTLPKSSILLTIPVAFIYIYLLILQITLLVSVKGRRLYRPKE
jgi:hypothetical protein